VITFGFFEMIRARDEYRKRFSQVNEMNWPLINFFIETILVILSPILSFTTEYIWQSMKKEGSIFNANFPHFDSFDNSLIEGNIYINKFLATARAQIQKTKGNKSQLVVHVASEHPQAYQDIVKVMLEYYNSHHTLSDVGNAKLNQFVLSRYPGVSKSESTKINKVVGQVKAEFLISGEAAFAISTNFNEVTLFEENKEYIKRQLSLNSFESQLVILTDGGDSKKPTASPGKPILIFS